MKVKIFSGLEDIVEANINLWFSKLENTTIYNMKVCSPSTSRIVITIFYDNREEE